MELFIKTNFWLSLVGAIIHLGRISSSKYPRMKSCSMGEDVASFLIAIIWALYAGVVLWVLK